MEQKISYIEVRKSKIHNNGAFAARDIPRGTRVIEYVGEKITKSESEKRADQTFENSKKSIENGAVYIFELNKKFDIDGNVPWNPAKNINHSCTPNCETENEEGRHIWIIALRDIKKGEEVTYNYGYDIDNYEDHPCRCGSENCVGYIVNEKDWAKLKKLLKKNENKK